MVDNLMGGVQVVEKGDSFTLSRKYESTSLYL